MKSRPEMTDHQYMLALCGMAGGVVGGAAICTVLQFVVLPFVRWCVVNS